MNFLPVLGVLTYLPLLLVPAVVIQYVRLRVLNALVPTPDPHVGRKAILHFFLSAAIIMGLAGLTVSATDAAGRAVEPLVLVQQQQAAGPNAPVLVPVAAPLFNDQQRTAAGLIVSALLHGGLLFALLRLFTNDRRFPAVGRGHCGLRLVVAGPAWMLANTVALISAFSAGATDLKTLSSAGAVSGVWGVAAAVHLWILLKASGRRKPADEHAE